MKHPKKLILLLFAICGLCISSTAQKQEIVIDYTYRKVYPMAGKLSLEVRANQNCALCDIIRKVLIVGRNHDSSEAQELVDHRYIYKDYSQNKMIYYELLPETYVEEELNLINWKVTDQTNTFLGYKCQKAECEFRGREYIAWFTTQLPFKAAPWKFHGLPGVVLQVVSKDEHVDFTATKLKIRESEEPIKNPYRKKKLINWEKYTELYKEYERRREEDLKAGEVRSGYKRLDKISTVPRIEIILEGNRIAAEDRLLFMRKLKENNN